MYMHDISVFNDDSNYNLCRDYSSFIKWSLDKISKISDNWTDYSVTEPDTLMLSSISMIHDYTQYIIDQMYLNTDLDVCSTKFLNQASSLMGKFLWNTNEVKIPVVIKNNSISDVITIEEFEMFNNGNELFTNPEKIRLLPGCETDTYFVRNTVNQKIFRISSNSIGEYYLNGNIERSSIVVYGISEDGSQSRLDNCSDILYLLFNNYDDVYMIYSENDELFKIKLSPNTYNKYTAILVKYTLVDDYPIKSGFILNRVSGNSSELTITVSDSINIVSSRDKKLSKLEYVNSLKEIKTLCNSTSSVNLGELSKRIKHYRFTYDISSDRDVLPLFEYATYDNKPLLGDIFSSIQGIQYINKASLIKIANGGYSLNLDLENGDSSSVIPYDIKFKYKSTDNVIESITVRNLDFVSSLTSNNQYIIDLYKFDTNYPIYIEFIGLGDFYEIIIDEDKKDLSVIPTNINQLESELQLLYEIFNKNIIIGNKLPVIRFLSPQYLNLRSTIIVKGLVDEYEFISEIVDYVNELLIHDDLISNNYISNRRLETAISDHFDDIVDMTINEIDRVIINPTNYLVMKSVNEYLSEISIKFKGDVQ